MARDRDRWVAISLSVLLHGALIAALAYGWWLFRQTPPAPQTLAIEATVVDARAVPGLSRPPPPPAPPVPQPEEEVGPPPPDAAERAHRDEEQKAQAERAAQEKAEAEQRATDEQAAQQKAVQERAAHEKAAAEAKQAAEQKRKAEAAAAADAQEQSEREADLKRSLAAESRSDPGAANAALASWRSQITAKITRAWLRPPTARAGLECDLYVTQVAGGEVTQVRLGQCNGDQAVRESIVAAAYRASPLPPPPDPALFDRDLKITFKPDLDTE